MNIIVPRDTANNKECFPILTDCGDESSIFSSYVEDMYNMVCESYESFDFSMITRAFFGLYSHKNKKFIHLLLLSEHLGRIQDVGKRIQKFMVFLLQPCINHEKLLFP